MDISCIISSGDIELYVLGLLPEDEAGKMEQLMLLFPEIKEEADRISEALEVTANAGEALPRSLVKEKFFAEISKLKVQEHANPNKLTVAAEPLNSSPVVTPVHKKRNIALIAASVFALIFLSGLVYFALRNLEQQEELAVLHDRLNNKDAENRQQALAYEQMLKVVKDYRQIDLNNIPGKPESLAKIFWHRQTAQVYVMDVSLPPPPSGKQYQLWAIVEGQPFNAGMLTAGENQLQKMANFPKADAFAITLEKAGGSTTPTLEEMYVLGETS